MKVNLGRLFLCYTLYYFLIEGALRDILIEGQTDSFDITSSVFHVTSFLIPFLYVGISYSALYKFYPTRRWFYCILGILSAIFITISCRYIIEQILIDLLIQQTNYPIEYGLKNYVIDNYFFAFRYITFGVIYYFVTYSLHKQKRESELLLSKQDMEMALLKSQLNPHFLINSLNNIYSLVFHKSDQAIIAMDSLTDILKYSLYESKEFETLEKELQIVTKYIALTQLRVPYPLHYIIASDTVDPTSLVPQHSLMPVVENVLKHGDLQYEDDPARTTLKQKGGVLHIHSTNKISKANKDQTAGIGLSNLERRLELLYPNKYTLKSRINDGRYYLDITIPVR